MNNGYLRAGRKIEKPLAPATWQEEKKEATALGTDILYICSMKLHCATYTEGKLVALCSLVKSESSAYIGTVAISRSNILPGSRVSGGRHVQMKDCPQHKGFL
ncbi:MAG: hypothetical protein HY617_02305 [Candidatus Sungbacteria bacterium]|nr:hypothetical protein [Candidatus Sungbacteria bacterium]